MILHACHHRHSPGKWLALVALVVVIVWTWPAASNSATRPGALAEFLFEMIYPIRAAVAIFIFLDCWAYEYCPRLLEHSTKQEASWRKKDFTARLAVYACVVYVVFPEQIGSPTGNRELDVAGAVFFTATISLVWVQFFGINTMASDNIGANGGETPRGDISPRIKFAFVYWVMWLASALCFAVVAGELVDAAASVRSKICTGLILVLCFIVLQYVARAVWLKNLVFVWFVLQTLHMFISHVDISAWLVSSAVSVSAQLPNRGVPLIIDHCIVHWPSASTLNELATIQWEWLGERLNRALTLILFLVLVWWTRWRDWKSAFDETHI